MVRSFLFKLITDCSKLLHLPKETVKPLSHCWNSFPVGTSLELKSHFFKKAWHCHIGVWMESRITEALKNWANFLGIKLAKTFLFFLISLYETSCHSEGESGSLFMLTYLHWKLKRVQVKIISFTLTTNSYFQLFLNSNMQWAPAVCQAPSWLPEAWRWETLLMP